MIFILDNYDSFTYNIIQILYTLNIEVKTARNREISVGEILAGHPSAILLSPGPGRPSEAGVMPELIRATAGRIPLLGICLGHQAIGEALGAKVVGAKFIRHGKLSKIQHNGKGIFYGLPQYFNATRYHSLVLDEKTLPKDLLVTARSAEDNEIMAVRHKTALIEGMQYHPESILTEFGQKQIDNFLLEVTANTSGKERAAC